MQLKNSKKYLYLTIIGFLTCTTVSACYWQTNRYFQSRAKWTLISKQLSKKQPDQLSTLKNTQKYALKYIKVYGTLNQKYMLVSRAKQGRMGYLVIRSLQYLNIDGAKQVILAVQGWIPQQFKYTSKIQKSIFKGILRQKQKSDYIHKKLKASDIQKFNINTYIDVQKAIKQLNLQDKNICYDYYLEILKQIDDSSHKFKEKQKQNKNVGMDIDKIDNNSYYPYQYSIDNFQLPYLTPDKHRAYALFWGMTSMVGFGAIAKVLKMR